MAGITQGANVSPVRPQKGRACVLARTWKRGQETSGGFTDEKSSPVQMQILWQPHTLAGVTLHSSLSSSPPLIKWPCSADNLISLRGPDTWFNCVHITDLFSPSGPCWGHMAADGTRSRYIKCFARNFGRYDSCLPPSIHPSRWPFSSGRNSRQPVRLRLLLLHTWHHRGRLLSCTPRQIASHCGRAAWDFVTENFTRPSCRAPVWSVFHVGVLNQKGNHNGRGIFFWF